MITSESATAPVRGNGIQFEPMPAKSDAGAIIETLLKRPGRIIYELHQERSARLAISLLLLALAGLATYGVVVGSLTGGMQLLIAPLKLALGLLVAVLICLPSLYIFIALAGIDARIKTVAGALFAAACLSALLLIGFAPVAWIFSQSTDSVAFMGSLHLLFWVIGIAFGLRMIRAMCRFAGVKPGAHVRLWSMIFMLVCFQMTATLRPIIARSDRFFAAEKKFFLGYWFESLADSNASKAKH